LVTKNTKLVCFSHCSNVVGGISPVKKITQYVHDKAPGSWVVVDGVAYAPHRCIDVQDFDVDIYFFSFYKVYGPHVSMLYLKEQRMLQLSTINHHFIPNDSTYKLEPGYIQFELVFSVCGIVDYLKTVAQEFAAKEPIEKRPNLTDTRAAIVFAYQKIAEHEEKLNYALLSYLKTKPKVKIIGQQGHDYNLRVPTIIFVCEGINSHQVSLLLAKHKIAVRDGDFYARCFLEEGGILEKYSGVVRVSMVHYNTVQQVEKLITYLDQIL